MIKGVNEVRDETRSWGTPMLKDWGEEEEPAKVTERNHQ